MHSPFSDLLRRDRSQERAFSMVEILAVVAIIGVLAALIVPVVSSMQVRAKQSKCISNLKAISTAFAMHLAENDNNYPGPGPAGGSEPNAKYFRWMHRLGIYMDLPGKIVTRTLQDGTGTIYGYTDAYREAVFHCSQVNPKFYDKKSGTHESLGTYGTNGQIIKSQNGVLTGVNHFNINQPSRTVVLADRYPGGGSRPGDEGPTAGYALKLDGPYPNYSTGASANHRPDQNPAAGKGACNFLFADGHVESIPLESIKPWPATNASLSRNSKIKFRID